MFFFNFVGDSLEVRETKKKATLGYEKEDQIHISAHNRDNITIYFVVILNNHIGTI